MRHATTRAALAGTLAMAVLACNAADETGAPTTFEQAKARAAATDKLLLVDFYASW
jgi:hypothetical protein